MATSVRAYGLQQHQKARRLHWTLHGLAQLSYGRLRLAITTTQMIVLLQFNQAQVCVCIWKCMHVHVCCMLYFILCAVFPLWPGDLFSARTKLFYYIQMHTRLAAPSLQPLELFDRYVATREGRGEEEVCAREKMVCGRLPALRTCSCSQRGGM